MKKAINNIKNIPFEVYFFVLFLNFTSNIFGQDNSDDLITDRPDQTESSAVVPVKSLQIESGFLIEKDENEQMKQKGYAYSSTLLRYGLSELVELRLGLEYLGEEIIMKSTDSTQNNSGFSPLYTGFKMKIREEEGWKPEIAFLGGLVFPFSASEDFKPSNTAANMRVALSHTLSDKLSLGYNLGIEWDGNSSVPGYFYSVALGIGITDYAGVFVEGFGLIYEEGDADHLLDAGITFLLLPNLQLDVSGGLGINEDAADSFIGFGLSYRLPK